MLYDISELTDVTREVLLEYVGPAGWYHAYEKLLDVALDYFFFGGVLAGEREVEDKLVSWGVPFEIAVKTSRKLYTRLREIVSIPEHHDSVRCSFNFSLYLLEGVLVLYPLDYNGPPTRIEPSPERAMLEIEQAIERGDYVPENIRRAYEQHRRVW